MTGFARVQGQYQDVGWTWEIRSVNARGLDVRCRLPAGSDGLETAARERVGRAFSRGSINVALAATLAPGSAVRVNEALLGQLLDVVAGWRHRFPDITPPSADGLLALRGVLEPVDAVEPEDVREAREAAMLESLGSAIDALAIMRTAEGARLAEVLTAQLDEIGRLIEAAEGAAAVRPDAIRARLRSLLDLLLENAPGLPEERLAQEAALLVAKGDIREELDRLKAHVGAAREMIAGGGAVGRRLDFLCQEFNREANTLCSKSSDVALTRTGLALKAVIEQFREQIQNIE